MAECAAFIEKLEDGTIKEEDIDDWGGRCGDCDCGCGANHEQFVGLLGGAFITSSSHSGSKTFMAKFIPPKSM